MSKTDVVRARINAETKTKAGKILGEYGLTHSAFINLSYHSLIQGGGIPISRNVPNDELTTALRASKKGKTERKSYSDVNSIMDELWSN